MFSRFQASSVEGRNWIIQRNELGAERARELAQQKAAQEQAQIQEQARQQRLATARAGVEKAKSQFSISDAEFVQPVIDSYKAKRVALGPSYISCSESYEYVGGSIVGRAGPGNLNRTLSGVSA
jgi:hypothetical protein